VVRSLPLLCGLAHGEKRLDGHFPPNKYSLHCIANRGATMWNDLRKLVTRRILIVDDNQAVRRALRSVIEAVPALVVCGEAENGLIGIKLAQELKPDLIILDLSMPVMNGFQAARIMRACMPSIPILMFTSFTGARLSEEAVAAGANKVLSKSSQPESLIHDLQDLLKNVA
jgi:DNA-binding NarL/FixJ family response regulator